MKAKSMDIDGVGQGAVAWGLRILTTLIVAVSSYWIQSTTEAMKAYEKLQMETASRVSRLESFNEYSEKRLDRIESKIDKIMENTKR